jgi:hypothetical protein
MRGSEARRRRGRLPHMGFLWLLLAVTAWAEPPKDVLDFFRTAAENLADQDTRGFLDHFDRDMPGYSKLRDEIEALAYADVSSTIEFASDEGDDHARTMQLDWIIRINGASPRRQLIDCKMEKRGQKWKITSLRPIEFFAQP